MYSDSVLTAVDETIDFPTHDHGAAVRCLRIEPHKTRVEHVKVVLYHTALIAVSAKHAITVISICDIGI